MELSYEQRKALRRIARGKSISRSMQEDPLIHRCYTLDIPEHKPLDEMNIAEWCDFEGSLRFASSHPVLTDFGQYLLDELEQKVQ